MASMVQFLLIGFFLTFATISSAKRDHKLSPVARTFLLTNEKKSDWDSNSKSAVELLREAILSDDNDALIDIFIKRYLPSRLKLAEAYRITYKVKLSQDFVSRMSGDYARLMIALAIDIHRFYAEELHDGIREVSADIRETLADLLCIKPEHINETKRIYKRAYNRDFVTDLRGLVEGSSWFPGDPFYEMKQDCFSNRPLFLASRLNRALLKEDFHSVDRLILICINEDVLDPVLKVYQSRNHQSLYDAIRYSTGGFYRTALLAIITHPRYASPSSIPITSTNN